MADDCVLYPGLRLFEADEATCSLAASSMSMRS